VWLLWGASPGGSPLAAQKMEQYVPPKRRPTAQHHSRNDGNRHWHPFICKSKILITYTFEVIHVYKYYNLQ
jgi:hypothetical protein